MSMSVELDLVLLRSSELKHVATHILHLLKTYQATEVCRSLLDAVESEALPPRVFSIFLPASKSIDCVTTCLYQDHSITIRGLAIKQYGKVLANPNHWQQAWEAMDGIDGILEYLAAISVDEAESFCASIGRCNTGAIKLPERAMVMEDIVKAMNSALDSNAMFKTPDKRPLEKFAAHLVPSCSSDFVKRLMVKGVDSTLYGACPKGLILKCHQDLVSSQTINAVRHNRSKYMSEDFHLYLRRLTSSAPPRSSQEKYFSSSMKFSEAILEMRLKNPEIVWPEAVPESRIYFGLLHRCTKRSRRFPLQRLHSIMDLGMRLLAQRPNLRLDYSRHDTEFWSLIKQFWSKWPEHWEDLFIKGIQLGLAGSKENISESFVRLSNSLDIKSDRVWRLLRLFCLNLTDQKVDIDKSQDLGILSKQRWNYNLFGLLPSDKKIYLLKILLRNKANPNFLTGVPTNSILVSTTVEERPNFNATLYLTQVQACSPEQSEQEEAYTRASEAWEELKEKSGSSREQQDRASYAKAAGLFAIASGSLELFDNHVTWLARYVRDPLTLKVVFAKDAIGSNDASNLLSGLPASISSATKLSQLHDSTSAANGILLKFHEHHKVAKREPSYQIYDWDAVSTLVQDAVQTRIVRAGKLQDKINATQGDVYSQIWSQTIAMIFQMGSRSMNRLSQSISALLLESPPKLLSTITQSLLDIDNKYRAAKLEGKEAEDESRMIERLTYNCLLQLTRSEDPTLAADIVVRVVIERPDAASWHRQLLGLGFFKRLPSKDAEQLLLNFSRAIGEKLEEQSYVRVGEVAATPSIVKVTTVKYLAQILQNAQFLSPEASIDVLLELFKVATHPDIRIATLESILSTLNSLAANELRAPVYEISEVSNPLIRKILLALDAVIPVIGSINERRPPKEQDWVEAEEDFSRLPIPSANSSARPLWSTLVHAADTNKNFKAYFVKHLLLPSVEVSVQEHRRWLTLFLKKYNADFSVETLPLDVPANQEMLRTLIVRFAQLVPAEVLRKWNTYIKFLLQPSASNSKFISALAKNEEKWNKPEVTHFTMVFGVALESAISNGTETLLGLIHHEWKPSILPGRQGISLQQVQQAVLQQTHLALLEYDKMVPAWNALISKFRHPTTTPFEFEKWELDCRPVLEEVIKMIESVRTPRWLKDPDRRPLILPTVVRPRLWALHYPGPSLNREASIPMCNQLGSDIVALIREQILDPRRIFDMEKLIKDIMTVTEKLRDWENVHIGLLFGTFDGVENAEENIRVKLALNFLSFGRAALKKKSGLKRKASDMIVSWQESLVEEVRESVLDLVANDSYGRLWDMISQED